MKSGRRHELQTNTLADFLGHALERYREYLPTVAFAGVAVLVVIVAFGYFGARRSSSTTSAWEDYFLAGLVGNPASPSDAATRLKQVADKYPDSDVALWARLDVADMFCVEGKLKFDIERKQAETRLREAAATYAEVLSSPRVLPDMIRRAALSEGKCWELLGDRAKAIESYKATAQKFATQYPDIAKDAASRASDLESPEAAEFYKQLAEYKPPALPALAPPLPGDEPPFARDRKEKSPDADAGGKEPGSENKDPKDKGSDDAKPKDEPPAAGETLPDKKPAEKTNEPVAKESAVPEKPTDPPKPE